MVEQYLNAQGTQLSTKVAKQDVRAVFLGTPKYAMRCFVCDGKNHRVVECPSKASTSQNEPFGCGCQSCCFKC